MYFRTQQDVMKFSNGFHMKYWKDFNSQTAEEKEKVEIWHEAFMASQVDTIYVNTEPTGIANLWEKDELQKEGEDERWLNGMYRLEKKTLAKDRMKNKPGYS